MGASPPGLRAPGTIPAGDKLPTNWIRESGRLRLLLVQMGIISGRGVCAYSAESRPTYSLAPSLGPPCSPCRLIAGLGSAPITDCVLWSPSWSRCPLAWGGGVSMGSGQKHVIKGHWASRAPSLAGILVPCCEPLGRDGPHPGVRAGGKGPRLRGAQGYGPAAPSTRQVNGLRKGNLWLADDGGRCPVM